MKYFNLDQLKEASFFSSFFFQLKWRDVIFLCRDFYFYWKAYK